MPPASLAPFSTPPSSPRPNRLQKANHGSPTPGSSPTFRSASPHRLMKTLTRWKGRDSLDFGCAGNVDWSDDGPSDLKDAHYSHSRGHSSSSSGSVSTVDSSLPPSPSLCHSSENGLHPFPLTSRVPLTPRSSEKKRRTDEALAIDAVNDYCVRARLSRVEEDEQQMVGGLGIVYLDTGVSTFTPPSPNPTLSPSRVPHALLPPQSSYLGVPNSPAPFSASPVPEADIPKALDELSLYFSSTETFIPTSSHSTTPSRYSYASSRSIPPEMARQQSHTRSTSSPAEEQPPPVPRSTHRPKFASEGQIVLMPSLSASSAGRARRVSQGVSYGWI